MPTDSEDSGFLSRWSRRKVQVREGLAPIQTAAPAPPTLPVAPRLAPAVPTQPTGPVALDVQTVPLPVQPAAPVSPADAEPPPTLADVALLTRDSDYSRFMARSVQPDVKNAALGKLFTDPHFNIMDGLDTYIDDYGKPDPLPPGMLRQMLQAHVLGLFDEEDEKNKTALVATDAQPACEAAPPTEPAADENTDLQLQPDDDAGHASAAKSVDEDPGCAH